MFLKTLSSQHLLQETIQEPDWLIQNLVAKGDATLFFGDSGSGKSFLLHYLGLTLGSGQSFLDYSLEQVPVLYLDKELPYNNFVLRHKMLIAGYPELAENQLFSYVNLPSCTVNPFFGKTLANQYSDYGLIIFDSYRLFKEGNANDADTAVNFLQSLAILKKKNIAVIIIHHKRKSVTEETSLKNQQSGSTVLIDIVDQAYALTLMKEEPGRMEVKVSHVKHRWPGFDNSSFSFQAIWDKKSSRYSQVGQSLE